MPVAAGGVVVWSRWVASCSSGSVVGGVWRVRWRRARREGGRCQGGGRGGGGWPRVRSAGSRWPGHGWWGVGSCGELAEGSHAAAEEGVGGCVAWLVESSVRCAGKVAGEACPVRTRRDQ